MKIAMPFAPTPDTFPAFSSLLWPTDCISQALLPAALWLGHQWEAGVVEWRRKRSSISWSALLHLSSIIWWKPCSSMADGDLSSGFKHTLRSDKAYSSCHFQPESSSSFSLFFLPIYFHLICIRLYTFFINNV